MQKGSKACCLDQVGAGGSLVWARWTRRLPAPAELGKALFLSIWFSVL